MAAFVILSLPAVFFVVLGYSWLFDSITKHKKKCKRICHAHVSKLSKGQMAILDCANCDECKKVLAVANIW